MFSLTFSDLRSLSGLDSVWIPVFDLNAIFCCLKKRGEKLNIRCNKCYDAGRKNNKSALWLKWKRYGPPVIHMCVHFGKLAHSLYIYIVLMSYLCDGHSSEFETCLLFPTLHLKLCVNVPITSYCSLTRTPQGLFCNPLLLCNGNRQSAVRNENWRHLFCHSGQGYK